MKFVYFQVFAKRALFTDHAALLYSTDEDSLPDIDIGKKRNILIISDRSSEPSARVFARF